MKKISRHTYTALFDKDLQGASDPDLEESEFIEKFGPVDLVLEECLNSSNLLNKNKGESDAEKPSDFDQDQKELIGELLKKRNQPARGGKLDSIAYHAGSLTGKLGGVRAFRTPPN